MTSRPLEGIRVVDFGWVWAVPVLGHFLGDMGAEVIKVESRKRLDFFRVFPPYVDQFDPDGTLAFHNFNRSKRSITLDITQPEGQQIVRELVRVSDVLIENYSPRVLKGLGLDYESLRQVKPDLVMASLSAMGQAGPQHDIVTYGPSLSGLAGLDCLVGYVGEGVTGLQFPYADPLAGLHGAFAVIAALHHRELTGEGTYIDMAQGEAVTSVIGEAMMDYFLNGRVHGPNGNRHPGWAPHGNFRCAGDDRWIAIAVQGDQEWAALCQTMGNPAWTQDERFATVLGRQRHQDELERCLEDWTGRQDAVALAKRLQAVGIAAAALCHISEQLDDPQLSARRTIIQQDHPRLAGEFIYGFPWKLSEAPDQPLKAAPLLGEDNDYVFQTLLKLPPAEIARLAEARVLF